MWSKYSERLMLCEKISPFGIKLSKKSQFSHFGQILGQKSTFEKISAKISPIGLKIAPNLSIWTNIDRNKI
jgi:hypothetical protein